MSPCGLACASRDWKGKGRAQHLDLSPRADSGEEGVLIPLDLLEHSMYSAVYTIPITIGQNKQVLPVQVDTGSSDLWIVSKNCGSQSCKQTGGTQYDPSGSTSANQDFTIRYVEGVVEGPIVWDSVQLGGYDINQQALAAATKVDDEPLSPEFVGVLGLALPQNSVIADEIPPVIGSGLDGASISSNIFSISPTSSAPAHRFMTMTLARPGADDIPSLLGIGRHSDVIPDPSLIEYESLVSGPTGSYFWEANLSAITVYVDGVRKQIDVGKSVSTGGTPTAIIDSGMPIILASQALANGIYGALGIGPGSDGQYYIPCNTPINMSITLDNRKATALHPLDLTIPTNGGSSCLGLIQAYPPSSSVSEVADIILGVPFMRSTYTVMAFDPPDASGKFPNSSTISMAASIRPRLGIFGLTDPTIALDEFHTVRVLNQPLSTSGTTRGGQASVSGNNSNSHPLSVGIKVLIGIGSFIGLCVLLFIVRWMWSQRTRKLRGIGNETPTSDKENEAAIMQAALYSLARRNSGSSRYGPSEDTLRTKKFEEYLKQKELKHRELHTGYDEDTTKTHVANDVRDEKFDSKALEDYELGYRRVKVHDHSDSEGSDAPAPGATWNDTRATLVDPHRDGPLSPDDTAEAPRSFGFEYPPSPTHNRLSSADGGVAMPLLAHTRQELDVGESDFTGIGSGNSRARMSIGSSRPLSQVSVGSSASRHSTRPTLEGRRRSSGASIGPRFGPRPGTSRVPSGLRESMVSGPAAVPLLDPSPPSPDQPLLNLSTDSNIGHLPPLS